jgi:TPR repeat protein
VTGSIEPQAAVEARPPPVPVPAPRLVDPKKRLDELLAQAARRIESGDVIGAREVLSGSEDGAQGSVSFALAETYDPNMLAAWGSRGVAADVAKARALYRKAFSLGLPRAQTRLEALK